MSWLTEIAGKAEDLLNRVDKTAATALQNKSKYSGFNVDTYVPLSNPKDSHQEFVANSESFTKATNFPSSPIRTETYNKRPQSNKSSPSTKVKLEKTDDEKLLQFLNSNEPLPVPSTKRITKSGSSLHANNEPKASENKSSDKSSINQTSENKEDTDSSMTSKSSEENAVQSVEQISEQDSASISVELSPSMVQSAMLEKEQLSENLPDTSMNEELLLANKRAEHAEAELRRMQKKLEHWNSQLSGNDKFVRQLQEREHDLTTAIDAKDSQLAVLKVRLQEADQELQSKRIIIEELKAENERYMKDNTDSTILHSQTLDNLREKLLETETELSRVRESYHAAQTEHMQRMSKMEDEQRHLAESLTNLQKKWSELNDRNKELLSQLKTANNNLETLQQEYTDYKQKAQRILQSKEKLITSLKEGNFDVEKNDANEASLAVLNAETEGIKQERDLLREELRRANDLIATYRSEIQELEKMAQNDASSARELCRNLEDQLQQEKMHKEEVILLCNQLKEELQFLREDFSRTKANLQSRIQDRESEIEKLRKQLTAKSLSTVSQDELESRLHALTENLIQKQTIVEALSTEKNSLVLQLERLEQQLKEAQVYGSQHHTVVGVSGAETDRKQKPSVFLENPFDSTLTRRVKRMYGSIDAFSIRLGVFFRRYPFARLFVIIYMLLLHLWVMIVLLTYEPEIHSTAYGKQQNTKS